MRTDFKRLLTSTFFIRILRANVQITSAGKRPKTPQIMVPWQKYWKDNNQIAKKKYMFFHAQNCPCFCIHHRKPIKVCPFITSTSTFRGHFFEAIPYQWHHASSTPAPGSGGSGLQTPPTASRAICQVSTGGLGRGKNRWSTLLKFNQLRLVVEIPLFTTGFSTIPGG